MKPFLSHLQINIAAANMPFYTELMTFLEWQTLYESEAMVGWGAAHGESLWFVGGAKPVSNDYDGPGVNHIALGAESQADVDRVAAHLAERGIARLFDTPRHRPEFSQADDRTYYQVMFESPDHLLFEVVYIGEKQG